MILFTILLMALAIVGAIALTITGVIGGATLIVFGDIIVFGLIVMLIIKIFKRKE